jgi:hypothetical protein
MSTFSCCISCMKDESVTQHVRYVLVPLVEGMKMFILIQVLLLSLKI